MTSLADLRAAFSGRLLTDAEAMAPFLTDWRGKWTGRALAVAQPDSTADVAHLLQWCSGRRIPVVTQGGNTGLSGGATPDVDGRAIVLSTARLNRVRAVDSVGHTLIAEAGVILQQVQEAARAAGRLFPLSLAAQGSCTIGGNLATNAGGVQVLRYGNARELCLGLEVVTPEGGIWDGLRCLRKDNTGYDLRDLFIGSEGTLGVITAAALKLFPLPAAQVVALAALPSAEAALELLVLAQDRLGAALTAFEFFSDDCLQLVEQHVPAARRPLETTAPWYALIEISSQRNEAEATSEMEGLLEQAMDKGHVADAAVSTSVAQFRGLWALREDISESQAAAGPTIKHDISLPIASIACFVSNTGAALQRHFAGLRPIVFGHLGDGNLHYNISPAPGMDAAAFVALEDPVNRLVHDAVDALGGSISAEHGLGVLRRDEAARFKSEVELRLMRAVKQAIDPLNLMNPGKVLRPNVDPSGSTSEVC